MSSVGRSHSVGGVGGGLPPQAGPLSQHLERHATKLADKMRQTIEEILTSLVVSGEWFIFIISKKGLGIFQVQDFSPVSYYSTNYVYLLLNHEIF